MWSACWSCGRRHCYPGVCLFRVSGEAAGGSDQAGNNLISRSPKQLFYMMMFNNGTEQLHLIFTGEEDYRAHRHTNTVFGFILEVVLFLPSVNTLHYNIRVEFTNVSILWLPKGSTFKREMHKLTESQEVSICFALKLKCKSKEKDLYWQTIFFSFLNELNQ